MARKYIPMDNEQLELPVAMEFILEGLHQSRMVGKDDLDDTTNYYDPLGDMMPDTDQRL